MMSFSYPAYLWSLWGVLVPIAIHFLSRKEGKTIKLGSLKHIRETSTQQFRGIRLNEWVLLVLRCLLVIVFSLLLSGLTVSSLGKKRWVLMEPGVEKNQLVSTRVDSLLQAGYEVRWFAEAFPLASNRAPEELRTYGHLLENLKDANLLEGVVFSFSKLARFGGAKPQLPANLKWITVPTDEQKFFVRAAQQGDSIIVRVATSHTGLTSFANETILPPQSEATPFGAVVVKIFVGESADARQTIILKSVLAAIDESTPFFAFQYVALADAQWVFWLSDQPAPPSAANMIVQRLESSAPLLKQIHSRTWCLTQLLREENVLQENFPVSLAALLTHDDGVDALIAKNDQRVIADSQLGTFAGDELGTPSIQAPMTTLLLFVFVALLITERLLSYHRQQ